MAHELVKEKMAESIYTWVDSQVEQVLGKNIFTPIAKKYVRNYLDQMNVETYLGGFINKDGNIDEEMLDFIKAPFDDRSFAEKMKIGAFDSAFENGEFIMNIAGKKIAITKNDVNELIDIIKMNK